MVFTGCITGLAHLIIKPFKVSLAPSLKYKAHAEIIGRFLYISRLALSRSNFYANLVGQSLAKGSIVISKTAKGIYKESGGEAWWQLDVTSPWSVFLPGTHGVSLFAAIVA